MPEEISIYNDRMHYGLLQSGETWMAECHGRTFVCSQINETERDDDTPWLSATFAAEQVSCQELAESPESERLREARHMAMAARASRPPSAPPTGAAGFEFGETPEEARAHCELAGETWENAGAEGACSGAAASLGLRAHVSFEFCEGRVCAITVEHVPEQHWSRRSISLKGKLEGKYGPVQDSTGTVPENCRTEEAFAQCLASRKVALTFTWRWVGGESVEMIVAKPDDTATAAIRLVYRKPRDTPNDAAL